LIVDTSRPTVRELCPVGALGCAILRQPCQLGTNFIKRQPHLLSKYDKGDPAENGPWIAAVSGTGALRFDQASILIEAEG
jgi:hypothetical protein